MMVSELLVKVSGKYISAYVAAKQLTRAQSEIGQLRTEVAHLRGLIERVALLEDLDGDKDDK